ncbi:MAG: DUF1134 domain-containing protein [Rhizobiales bacterium]|nr:DUF1134 domain-containing protein [Hyphomicrobiales bacterium]
MNRFAFNILAGLTALMFFSAPITAQAQTQDNSPSQNSIDQNNDNSYSPDEVLSAGHEFFGGVSRDLALAVESLFSKYGQPNGYILGEEGGGAIIGGLRYGEGTLHTRNSGEHKIYWQGPSIGWDFGADAGRTMMLIYNMNDTEEMYRRYIGVSGSAYLIGGLGITILSNSNVVAAPIRAGVGARLGISAGYLKFTHRPTWNPF